MNWPLTLGLIGWALFFLSILSSYIEWGTDHHD